MRKQKIDLLFIFKFINSYIMRKNLNTWLSAVLWLAVGFNSLNLIFIVSQSFSMFDISVFTALVYTIFAAVGAYLMVKERRIGLYMLAGALLFKTGMSVYQFCSAEPDDVMSFVVQTKSMLLRPVVVSICQIIFLALLMLLKCNGKNAYQFFFGARSSDDSPVSEYNK